MVIEEKVERGLQIGRNWIEEIKKRLLKDIENEVMNVKGRMEQKVVQMVLKKEEIGQEEKVRQEIEKIKN